MVQMQMYVYMFVCIMQLVSSEQQLEIESAAIEFFSSVIACHAKNQLTFALILCDVIQTQRNVVPGMLCMSFFSKRSRSLFAVSVCRSVICLSFVTLLRPTQAVQIFGNISTALGTLAIR